MNKKVNRLEKEPFHFFMRLMCFLNKQQARRKTMMLSTKLNILVITLLAPLLGHTFDSGSTGADGAFNPSANIEVPLPPSGILNYTTFNIPNDVTVTFAKNAGNTPVTILISGDAIIEGIINLSGSTTGATSDTDVSDDGLPGIGGPGGFDGGHGGYSGLGENNDGGHGQGPGGGGPGLTEVITNVRGCGAAGAGYALTGISLGDSSCPNQAFGGPSYGNDALIPIIGGSGGGGGAGLSSLRFGTGGGGGGGAILIAASGSINITGSVIANGGGSGSGGVSPCAGTGGGGSGGAIRIIASNLSGSGTISATGGISSKAGSNNACRGKDGSPGRIRLEAETMQFTAQTTPAFSFGGPSPVFVPNLPTITVASVAGITAPATPTGTNDIVLPDNTPNPVDVVFATSDIPTGGTITLTATPIDGSSVSADSTPIAADGTATVSINLPNGPNTLIASTTFTVTASLGKDFSMYAMGEQVKKVRVGIDSEGKSETTFISISGNEFSYPSNAVAMN